MDIGAIVVGEPLLPSVGGLYVEFYINIKSGEKSEWNIRVCTFSLPFFKFQVFIISRCVTKFKFKFNRGWISFECTIPLYVTGNINVTIGGRIFPVDIANNNFSIVVDRLTIFNFFFFSPLRSMTMINVIIYLIHYSIHFLLKDQRY